MCEQGRPEATAHGVRIFAGQDDPRPGWPFPFPESEPPAIDEAVFRADVGSLRNLLA